MQALHRRISSLPKVGGLQQAGLERICNQLPRKTMITQMQIGSYQTKRQSCSNTHTIWTIATTAHLVIRPMTLHTWTRCRFRIKRGMIQLLETIDCLRISLSIRRNQMLSTNITMLMQAITVWITKTKWLIVTWMQSIDFLIIRGYLS